MQNVLISIERHQAFKMRHFLLARSAELVQLLDDPKLNRTNVDDDKFILDCEDDLDLIAPILNSINFQLGV